MFLLFRVRLTPLLLVIVAIELVPVRVEELDVAIVQHLRVRYVWELTMVFLFAVQGEETVCSSCLLSRWICGILREVGTHGNS